MHIVLGGTGHVGGAVVRALADLGEETLVIVHDEAKAATLRAAGGQAVAIDLLDVPGLCRVFKYGKRAFLLNPPAAPSTDTDAVERKTASSIVAALEGSGLEMVVAQSTYGAQPGERCGDLTTLYGFEQALKAQPIPVTIMRAAYLMTNLEPQLDEVRRTGQLASFFPEDFQLPMVAPADLGVAGARFMTAPTLEARMHHVEGPERYTFADVADVLTETLERPVSIKVTPREDWAAAYAAQGFSKEAAASYACMTAATLDGRFPSLDAVERGETRFKGLRCESVSSAPIGIDVPDFNAPAIGSI